VGLHWSGVTVPKTNEIETKPKKEATKERKGRERKGKEGELEGGESARFGSSLGVASGLPLISGYALPYFCGKSCSLSVGLYVVVTSMQARAQALQSKWSELPPELLDTIAQRIARDRAAVRPFHRELCSAGYSLLLPVCNKWMQLASACSPPGGVHRVTPRLHGEYCEITLICFAGVKTVDLLLTYLAELFGVVEAEIADMEHFEITEQFEADTVARLRYLRNVHSLKVSLNYQGQPAFKYYRSAEIDGLQRVGRIQYDLTILQAALSLKHLTSIDLTAPCGDSFAQLPWETMTSLRELHSYFKGRVAHGTFGFLPRIPHLEHFQADVDFFSVPSLGCMTTLKSLNICLAPPEDGVVDVAQARERDDDVLYQIRNLTGLEKLDFGQQATLEGLVGLTKLTSLTSLSMRLPNTSPVGLDLWSVVKLFQSHQFQLQYLHFEFKLDGHFAVAYLDNELQHSANQPEVDLCFPVPWSTSQVVIKKLFEHK